MLSRSSLLALAASVSYTAAAPHFVKRWDTSLCTADNVGTPIPASDTFQLPLEGLRQTQCRDLCVGDCTTTTQICWDFSGANLIFTYQPLAGYNYTEADIWLGFAAPSDSPTPQFNSANDFCTIAADGSSIGCDIPYTQLTSNSDVLAGMCPDGDQAGLVFYLYTNAMLNSAATGDVEATNAPSCSDYPTCSSNDISYWELTYRCTKCPAPTGVSTVVSATPTSTPATSTTSTVSTQSPTPTPTVVTCPYGVAFGYSLNPLSLPFELLFSCPKDCQRWGWYELPTTSQLAAGISGSLYVGVGGNFLSKAVDVGSFKASLTNGKVSVTYNVLSGYSIGEVHVDIGCTSIKTCNPDKFAYSNTALANDLTTFTTPGLAVPSCSKGSLLYLIVNASIDKTVSAKSSYGHPYKCPVPCAL